MEKLLQHPHTQYWLQKLPTVLLIASWILASGAVYYGWVYWQAHQLNQAYAQKSLLKTAPDADYPLQSYMVGYLQAHHIRKKADVDNAAKAYALSEASDNPTLRARAKLASGNLYFDLAMQSANIGAGGAHQLAVAQIELARESYKDALRLVPEMEAARFNLELLDRLSPEKRTAGWQAETDGSSLQPFKRNGTAMMRDNTLKGLP